MTPSTSLTRRQLPVVLEVDQLIDSLKARCAALEDNAHEDHLTVPFSHVGPWLRDLQRIERHLRAASAMEA